MAISPIGGMVYANQNMQVAATQQADFQQRLEAQSTAAMVASNQEKKEIEEVRPTEETLEMDPEHEKKKEEENEQKERKELSEEEELLQMSDDEEHFLDITI